MPNGAWCVPRTPPSRGQGRPLPTGVIASCWEMLVVAAFSPITCHRARAVGLPRDEMMRLVDRQAAVPGEAAAGAGAGR